MTTTGTGAPQLGAILLSGSDPNYASILILENGSIVSGANTYARLDTVGIYQSNRGRSAWPVASSYDRERAILRAMDYIESLELRLQGQRVSTLQPLSWPRSGVTGRSGFPTPTNEIPTDLVSALCEAAYHELTSPNFLFPTYASSSFLTSSTRQIGSLKKVDVYATTPVTGAVAITGLVQLIEQYFTSASYGGGGRVSWGMAQLPPPII